MFGILFGWRKASKCKKVVKRAQCRIKLLKNKKNAIVRQSREDVAELIKYGYEETALNRVEQFIKDKNLAAVYELLDQFCEFVLVHLSYIRRHKDCPNDINEAVSSLIYASARCGDLPELCRIRKLFGHRYGQKFAATAMELFPGNLVNIQLKEKLSVKSVPDDLKFRVIDEIARDNCNQPEVLAIDYYPDWQLTQVKENNAHQVVNKDSEINDTIAGSEMLASEIKDIKRDIMSVDSSGKNSLSKSSPQDYSASKSSALISSIQPHPPYIINAPLHEKVEKVENLGESSSLTTSGLKGKGKAMDLTSSAQSLHTFPEELVVYLDDIEGRQFSVSKYGGLQDQRLFKFRTSSLPSRKKIEFDYDQSDTDRDESRSDKSSRKSLKKTRRASEKRSRRRSASLDNQSVMDIECMIYYYKPCKNPSAHYWRKLQKLLVEETPKSSYSRERFKEYISSEMERNFDSCHSEGRTKSAINLRKNGCSLDHPCYFSVYDDKDPLTGKPKREIRTIVGFPKNFQQEALFGECSPCQHFPSKESTEDMEGVKIFKKPGRRNCSGAEVYNVFTYPDCLSNKQTKEIKAEKSEYSGSFASSGASCLSTTDCLTRTETAAPYSRAVTMPPERPKDKDKMLRTYSCPPQHPNHVHPKLPEYDDLAARFAALKKERLQNKQLCATGN